MNTLQKNLRTFTQAVNGVLIAVFILLLLIPFAYAVELPPNIQKMYDHERDIALGITFLAAFLAGIVTFTSPCGFALLPTYFAVAFKERKNAFGMTVMFSIGLATALALVGIIAGIAGTYFNPHKQTLALASGAALIAFGVLLLLNKTVSFLNFHVDHQQPKKSYLSMFLVGFFFTIGWTPCIGAILGGVILLAANTGTMANAIGLLLTYAAGISLPLILISYLADRNNWTPRIQGRARTITILGRVYTFHLYNLIGGIILIGMGVIMLAFEGTSFFQIYIPAYTPWGMEWWGAANTWLAENQTMRSTGANIAGLATAGAAAFLSVRYIINHLRDQ